MCVLQERGAGMLRARIAMRSMYNKTNSMSSLFDLRF